jgi:hypothetical protein
MLVENLVTGSLFYGSALVPEDSDSENEEKKEEEEEEREQQQKETVDSIPPPAIQVK